MTDTQLAQLVADDDLGLLTVKPKCTPQTNEEERLLEGFREIVGFVESKGAVPGEQSEDMGERLLFARLEGLRRQPRPCALLKPFDEHGLLAPIERELEEAPPISMEDLLNDKFLDSLESEVDDIFKLRHVPAKAEFDGPDYVAQRKPCREFFRFEEQLRQCQRDLKEEKRRLLPFANEQQIEAGKFFVLRGVLLLVVEIGERAEKKGKWNARLRCVFENGTESDMLLRSLSSELYKDGRRVTELEDGSLLNPMLITGEDKASGFVYVLRSLSRHPDILAVPNLYKIGLARRSIEARLRHAASEPTYLMAPVALVSTFQCYNVNLSKLESLLHRFFDRAAARIQIQDAASNYHTPKEWFSVPLAAIETAVRLLISGEIVNYAYHPGTEKIVSIDYNF